MLEVPPISIPHSLTPRKPLAPNPSHYLKALRAKATPARGPGYSWSIGPGPGMYNVRLQFGKRNPATQRYYTAKPDPLFSTPRLPVIVGASPGAIYDVKAPSLIPSDFAKGPGRAFHARLHEEFPDRESFMGIRHTGTANVNSVPYAPHAYQYVPHRLRMQVRS